MYILVTRMVVGSLSRLWGYSTINRRVQSLIHSRRYFMKKCDWRPQIINTGRFSHSSYIDSKQVTLETYLNNMKH